MTNKFLQGQYGQAYAVDKVHKDQQKKASSQKKKASGKATGFFLEAGACNGESISNTLFFEVKQDWTGLLVEPNPDFVEALKMRNRNAWILPHCLSTSQRVETVQFDAAAFNGGIIKEGKVLPSDLGRNEQRIERMPHERKMTVRIQDNVHNFCFALKHQTFIS